MEGSPKTALPRRRAHQYVGCKKGQPTTVASFFMGALPTPPPPSGSICPMFMMFLSHPSSPFVLTSTLISPSPSLFGATVYATFSLCNKSGPSVTFLVPHVVSLFSFGVMFHHQWHCQAFKVFLLVVFFTFQLPLSRLIFLLWLGCYKWTPLAPSIWVFFNPICIRKFVSFCDRKWLLFVYLWIALLETYLTLQFDIYFLQWCFVLPTQGGTTKHQETRAWLQWLLFRNWRNFKWSIFFEYKSLL